MPNENDNKLVTLADLAEAYTALYNRDVMTSADKTKLDGIETGAQVNTITGVKGDAEASYRQGNVNITPANIGAVSKAGGDIINGSLSFKNADSTIRYSLTAWPDNDFAISGVGSIYSEGWSRLVYIQSDGTISLQAPLPVTSGGTGATTPAGARANLELTPSTSQTIATGIFIVKIGNLAFISCDGNNVIALPPGTWVTLGSLPNGYAPFGNFYGTILNGASADQSGVMHITESGTVQYYNSGTTQTTALWGSMMFPISNN